MNIHDKVWHAGDDPVHRGTQTFTAGRQVTFPHLVMEDDVLIHYLFGGAPVSLTPSFLDVALDDRFVFAGGHSRLQIYRRGSFGAMRGRRYEERSSRLLETGPRGSARRVPGAAELSSSLRSAE